MKTTYKNIKTRILSIGLALTCLVAIGIIVHSCTNDDRLLDNEVLDEEILNSPELEELIISGAEYSRALTTFTDELSKIDFSTLEVTYDAEGGKVAHLPVAFVAATDFDKKERSFYEKKGAFRKKFPQFTSFSEETGKKYFRKCVQNSVNIRSEFLKLGIKVTLIKLKNGGELAYDENFSYMMWQMYNWVNNPYFVEIYILGYADGSYGYVQMTNAGTHNGGDPFNYQTSSDNKVYYNGQQIISIGHPHPNNSTSKATENYYDPGCDCIRGDYLNVPPGFPRYIYYEGSIYYY